MFRSRKFGVFLFIVNKINHGPLWDQSAHRDNISKSFQKRYETLI